MSEWLALALMGTTLLATGAALHWRLEARGERRRAQIALRMAADAVEARMEMERNTPVMVLAGPEGERVGTAKVQRVQYWLN